MYHHRLQHSHQRAQAGSSSAPFPLLRDRCSKSTVIKQQDKSGAHRTKRQQRGSRDFLVHSFLYGFCFLSKGRRRADMISPTRAAAWWEVYSTSAFIPNCKELLALKPCKGASPASLAIRTCGRICRWSFWRTCCRSPKPLKVKWDCAEAYVPPGN